MKMKVDPKKPEIKPIPVIPVVPPLKPEIDPKPGIAVPEHPLPEITPSVNPEINPVKEKDRF